MSWWGLLEQEETHDGYSLFAHWYRRTTGDGRETSDLDPSYSVLQYSDEQSMPE